MFHIMYSIVCYTHSLYMTWKTCNWAILRIESWARDVFLFFDNIYIFSASSHCGNGCLNLPTSVRMLRDLPLILWQHVGDIFQVANDRFVILSLTESAAGNWQKWQINYFLSLDCWTGGRNLNFWWICFLIYECRKWASYRCFFKGQSQNF